MLGLEIQRLPMPFGQTPYTISKFSPVNYVCHLCGYWHRGCGRICSSSGLVEEQNHFPLKSQLNFLSLGEMRGGLPAARCCLADRRKWKGENYFTTVCNLWPTNAGWRFSRFPMCELRQRKRG